jgi:hypothetical protein
MTLNELLYRARTGYWDDARLLSDLLKKLENIFKHKWDSILDDDPALYFENLGCEVRYGPIPFTGSEDIVPINFIRKFGNVHINVPIDIAERALAIGLP